MMDKGKYDNILIIILTVLVLLQISCRFINNGVLSNLLMIIVPLLISFDLGVLVGYKVIT